MINNKIVVYTAGTWDLFHRGHVNILRKSKELGDILIVGVSTDKLVKKYKKIYPTFSYRDRRYIVDACKYVDKSITQEVLLDIKILKKYKVDIITIGSDWKDKKLKGLDYMRNHGKVVYLPYTSNVSTTVLKRKIIKSAFDILKADILRNRTD